MKSKLTWTLKMLGIVLGLVLVVFLFCFMFFAIRCCVAVQGATYQEEFTVEVHDRQATPEEIAYAEKQIQRQNEYNNAMAMLYAQSEENINNYELTLTKASGVYNYNNKKETYYGPHAAYDYLCKADGNGVWRTKQNLNYNVETHSYYIDDVNGVPTWLFVIASSELSKYSYRQISYGLAVVWDCGCSKGIVDVFVGPKWY